VRRPRSLIHEGLQRAAPLNDPRRVGTARSWRRGQQEISYPSEIGPPPRARIAPEQVKRGLAKAGYELAAEHDFLPNQYFLIFKPN
jgi:hypothetical protein